MGGDAILDANVLVDGLVQDVIDPLRSELNPLFGLRPYLVFLRKRTWSGSVVGDGDPTDEEIEIDPQPRVLNWGDQGGLRYNLEPCGLANVGEITLTEVSLSYTFDQLTGGINLGPSQEFRIVLKEANGQGDPEKEFIHSRPPYKDREKDFGWVLWLRSAGSPA